MQEKLVIDAIISNSELQGKELWYIRESIPEANRLVGAICSSDISVPISNIPDFIEVAFEKIGLFSRSLQINCFGHLGDGNIHFNVFPPYGRNKDEFKEIKDKVADLIHQTAIDLEGSFSAEHGVGRLKVGDLEKYGDYGKINMMRAIKKALDPNLILNPGVLFIDL